MPVKPSWRKPAGVAAILLLIAAWAFLAVTGAEMLGDMPWPVFALYFTVMGIAWILPLKPLLRWMELGRFRGRHGTESRDVGRARFATRRPARRVPLGGSGCAASLLASLGQWRE